MSLSRDIAESYVSLVSMGNDAEKVATAVVKFLKENNLQALERKVLEHVSSIEETERAYNSVQMTFAKESTDKYAKDIAKTVTGDDVEIRTETDDSLIGGFKARYKGREWDASIEGVLERLRAKLKTN